MKTISKILVNVEEHHDSTQAIAKAVWLAERSGAAIELFCCCFNLSVRNGYLFDREAGLHAQHAYLRQVEDRLLNTASSLQNQGLTVGVDVAWDRHHCEGVLRKAQRYGPDLLIHQIGVHSRLGHYWMAHQDWQLLRDCTIPVLLVKAHQWGRVPRVAACVDPFHECDAPAELDRAILNHACLLARLADGRLHVVHSYHALPQAAIFDEHVVTDYAALQKKVARKHAEALEKMLDEHGYVDAENVHQLEGETHLMLPAFAAQHRIDVMVMGSIARGFVDRMLLGSTIERIFDEMDCDVLAVKPAASVVAQPG
ncbi:universal stress protein [Marinobacterium rhizophilum]|uniref:Universal stress protein n=1 Tax=Marinobacterium rhizophilum TaxID=420402 RepID=A0ABY5HMU0_9GAMM|nr:universal stress protein [Marinobacterium rhizophilum]UTW13725.1 universal stress protein [Marinobacterium rhizophilum]